MFQNWPYYRFVVVGIVVASSLITIVTRFDVNMGITAMTVQPKGNETGGIGHCPAPIAEDEDDDEGNGPDRLPGEGRLRDKVFDWNETTQGNIIGSFFWSYILFQVASGFLAEKWGGKWIITICLAASGILTLVIPFIADSVTWFILLRVLMGVLQSGFFSSVYGIIFKWTPLRERSVCFALTDFGSYLGGIMVGITSGPIHQVWGWPALFYVPAAGSMVLSIIAGIGLRSSPQECTFISDKERNIIDEEEDKKTKPSEAKDKAVNISVVYSGETDSVDIYRRSSVKIDRDNNGRRFTAASIYSAELPLELPTKRKKVPWMQILTNRAVITGAFFRFTLMFMGIFMATKLPVYLKTVLNQKMTINGYINGSRDLTGAISIITCGYASERIIERNWFGSRTRTRKVFAIFTCGVNGLLIMMIPLCGCSLASFCVLIFFQTFSQGFAAGSDAPLASEMSQNFPSLMFATMNTVAMSAGFLAPMFAGLMLDNIADKWLAWNYIFYSVGTLGLFATLMYCLFASAERQPFDYEDGEDGNPRNQNESATRV